MLVVNYDKYEVDETFSAKYLSYVVQNDMNLNGNESDKFNFFFNLKSKKKPFSLPKSSRTPYDPH